MSDLDGDDALSSESTTDADWVACINEARLKKLTKPCRNRSMPTKGHARSKIGRRRAGKRKRTVATGAHLRFRNKSLSRPVPRPD